MRSLVQRSQVPSSDTVTFIHEGEITLKAWDCLSSHHLLGTRSKPGGKGTLLTNHKANLDESDVKMEDSLSMKNCTRKVNIQMTHSVMIFVVCHINILSSVQSLSPVWLFATPWIAAFQASLSITNPGVYSNSCPSSQWCHPAISSSVVPFSSCPQSLPESGSFPMSQSVASRGQNIGVSASASVLPMNTQDWSPLGWTGWISLQSKGLSGVFSSITVQKHQFFGAQLSSQFNSHIHTWPLEKP